MKTVLTLLCSLLLVGCDKPAAEGFPGYAEGEFVRLGAPLPGTLAKVHVRRGDLAVAGKPAYVLEQASEAAERQEAASRVERAQAQLADLRKGERSDAVAAVAAQLREAEAAMALSQANLERDRKLADEHFIARSRLDQSSASLAADRARVEQVRARVRTARRGARPDQVAAAEKEVDAARAHLAQAQWRVDQKAQVLPVSGLVTDVGYREGEFVPAGAPIITLLPEANIKARFFIPQAQLGRLRIGQAADITCDGCGQGVKARISFIAPEAEFTSPLIYSKENRASLVFMVEARLEAKQALQLHPGQPLTVRIVP